MLMRQAPTPEIVKGARALVDDEGEAAGVGEAGELIDRRFGGEPYDSEIRLVGYKKGRGMFADSGGVVFEMGAVCAPDLNQLRARSFHNVGQSERAAYLNQLAAGDNDLAFLGMSFEDEKKRCRIVIDHHRAFGTADPGDSICHSRQALTATALTDVVFKGEV